MATSSSRIKAMVPQEEKISKIPPVNEILSRDDSGWSSKKGHSNNNVRTPRRAILQPLLDHNNKIICGQQGRGQGRSPRFLVSRKSPIIESKSHPKPKPKPKLPAKQRGLLFKLESGGSGSEGTEDSDLDEFERKAKEFHKIKRHVLGSVITKLVMKKLIMDESNFLKQPDVSSSGPPSSSAPSSADSGFYEEKSRSN